MKKFCIKFLILVLLVMVVISSNTIDASTRNPYIERFFELYDIIHNYKVSQMMPYEETKTLGYFSPEGVPYHAFETFLCEAPDYGHETTSETYSYYLWLEAMYFKLTHDYTPFRTALQSMENYIIPGAQDQPVRAANDAVSTITSGRYAKQSTTVTEYPVLMYTKAGAENKIPRLDDPSKQIAVPVYFGNDLLAQELTAKYNNKYVYGMHWLLDTDNFFGFSYKGDFGSPRKATYLATCERGGAESSWSTIPHPNWKDHTYGNNTAGDKGFSDIFLNSSYGWKPEYSYSVATDADARAIQAAYMAAKILEKTRPSNKMALRDLSAKMGKMGNSLRYGLRTKYFLPLGMKFTETIEPIYKPTPSQSTYTHRITVHNPDVAKNPEKNVHYLLGWNYAWGAAIDDPSSPGNYPWRIGDDNVHAGYQNPMAAYALSKYDWFKNELTNKIDVQKNVLGLNKTMPTSEGGAKEWSTSLNRQLELIRWLQSAEGAIGGGVTNCWNGNYSDPNKVWDPSPPIPTPTADDLHNLANYRTLASSDPNYRRSFYGMYYTDSPVYFGQDPTKLPSDPNFRNPDGDSNAWIGWQVWLMQRLAELYLEVDTADPLKTKLETILDKWITWASSVTKLDPADPAGSIKTPGALVWSGQPDRDWAPTSGDALPPANTGYHVSVKKDGGGNDVYYVDTSVAGNLARTYIYYAAGKRKHTGNSSNPTVVATRNLAQQILDLLYANYKDERGYANEYRSAAFVNNFFNAKVYVPGTRLKDGSPEMVKRTGFLPTGMGMHKAGSRYGDVFSRLESSNDPRNVHNYMTYDQIRARFEINPGPQGAKDISYTKLLNARNGVNNDDPNGNGVVDPDEDPNGVTIRWHRFFSQVEIALAFAEFGIYFGDEAKPRNDITWGPITIDTNAAAKYGVYGSEHTDFHDRAKLYITKSTNNEPSTFGQIGVGKDSSSNPQMILGYASYVGNVICGQPKLWLRGPIRLGDVLAAYDVDWSQGSLVNDEGPRIVLENLCKNNPNRDLGFLNYSFDASKCYASNNDSDNVTVNSGQNVEKWNGVYKNISVGSNGARLTFKGGGVFYCNNFTTEPDAILDFDTSTHPVIIIAKGNVEIKSRTKMNVTNDDASKVLIISASQNQVYLAPDSKWRGTIFAPNTNYLNVDLGFKADVKGAFIGKSVVIHQSTDIFQVPFNYTLLTTSLPGYRSTPPSSASTPSSGSGSGSSWSWWNWSW